MGDDIRSEVISFLLSSFESLLPIAFPLEGIYRLGRKAQDRRKIKNIVAEALEKSVKTASPELSDFLNGNKELSKKIWDAVLLQSDPDTVTNELPYPPDVPMRIEISNLVRDVQNSLIETDLYKYLDETKYRTFVHNLQNRQCDKGRSIRIFGESYSPSPVFVGRTEETAEIKNLIDRYDLVFVSGDGGIGKSEICRKVALEIESENHCSVVWTTFRSSIRDTILTSTRIAGGDGSESYWDSDRRFEECLMALRDPEIILIIDGLDTDVQNDVEYERVLSLPCRKIITTRRKIPSNFASVTIHPMNDEDALQLIRNTVEINYRQYVDGHRELVCNIVEAVERHTLTLIIIGGLVNNGGIGTFRRVKDLFEGELSNKLVPGDVPLKESRVVDRLCRLFDTAGLDISTKEILRRLSLLPLDDMPLDYLRRLVQLQDNDTHRLDRCRWISLIGGETDRLVSMHSLVREALRHTLQPTVSNCEDVFDNIERLFSDGDSESRTIRSYVSTMFGSIVEVLCEYGFSVTDGEPYTRTIHVVMSFGEHDAKESRFDEAVDFFERCRDMEVRMHPRRSSIRMQILNNYATCLNYVGQNREALELLNKSMRLYRQSNEENWNTLFRIHNNKAVAYHEMSVLPNGSRYLKYSMANYKKAEKIIEDHMPDKLWERILFSNNYGNLLMKLDRYDDAIDQYEKGLRICGSCGPSMDVENAHITLNINKSMSLTSIRRFDESMGCLDEAYKEACKYLPEINRTTGLLFKAFGMLYTARLSEGDFEYAIASYVMSREILLKMFLETHPFLVLIENEIEELVFRQYSLG